MAMGKNDVSFSYISRVGLTIASYPIITIVISIIVPLLLSIGMYKYKFNEDFAELLLPPSSRIFEDRAWVQEHVPYEQRVVRLILKNENVLTRESLLGVCISYISQSFMDLDWMTLLTCISTLFCEEKLFLKIVISIFPIYLFSCHILNFPFFF